MSPRPPKGTRILVSLGGNALGTDFEELVESVTVVAGHIVQIIENGYHVVLCHGNGPQVGMIKSSLDRGKAHYQHPMMPLSECVAMSQAYIGYHLQDAIENQFRARDIDQSVCTVISRVKVDPDDPKFQRPTKPVGAFFTEAEANMFRRAGKWMVEDAGRGYREVVPSPMPRAIVERQVIGDLVDAGYTVIAGGGGGIPVVFRDGVSSPTDAVIDKDHVSAMLATDTRCEQLAILTGVEKVALHFNTDRQRDLDTVTVADAERYIAEGHFPEGSMLPKVQAAIKFARSQPGRKTLITSLDKLAEGLRGETGTWIVA